MRELIPGFQGLMNHGRPHHRNSAPPRARKRKEDWRMNTQLARSARRSPVYVALSASLVLSLRLCPPVIAAPGSASHRPAGMPAAPRNEARNERGGGPKLALDF